MALVKCVECGKEISDKAVTCPNCGVQVVSQKATTAEEKKGNFIQKEKSQPKKIYKVLKLIRIIVAIPLIALLILFGISFLMAVHKRTTPVTLINEIENVEASSWRAIPFTCPYTGYLRITALVTKGNEINIEVIDQDAVEALKKRKTYNVYTNFTAAKTGNYNQNNIMNEGTHYLLLKDNTLGILSSSSSDVAVKVYLSPSNN